MGFIDECGVGINGFNEACCGDFRQTIEMIEVAVADEGSLEAVDSFVFEIGNDDARAGVFIADGAGVEQAGVASGGMEDDGLAMADGKAAQR